MWRKRTGKIETLQLFGQTFHTVAHNVVQMGQILRNYKLSKVKMSFQVFIISDTSLTAFARLLYMFGSKRESTCWLEARGFMFLS